MEDEWEEVNDGQRAVRRSLVATAGREMMGPELGVGRAVGVKGQHAD